MRRVFNRSHSKQKELLNGANVKHLAESRTEFELTSIRIHQCIEKRKYQEVVDILRGLQKQYLLKCLESLPFKILNQTVPDSFLIWETLFVKINNFEEGSITPKVPYTACYDLVIKIGEILAYLNRHHDLSLYTQCRRVLKCVYMHYLDIMDDLIKDNERISRALYSLTLHIPLGIDSSAKTLQESIHEEVYASLIDFNDSLERLEDLPQHNIIVRSVSKRNGYQPRNNCSQRELQERLHCNNCILHTVLPTKRKDNLSQLLEMLNSRIQGDKDVLTIFGSLRQRHEAISDCEPVEPHLRHHQHSIECTITLLKEIQNELAIKTSPSPSPDKCASPELEPLAIEYPLSSAVSLDQDKFPILTSNNHITRKRSSSEKLLNRIRPVSASTIPYNTDVSCSDQELSSPSQKYSPQTPAATASKKKGGLIKRSLRNSMRHLSWSTGNVSSKSKYVTRGSDNEDIELQTTKQELMEAREKIVSLKRRERELTDRLSEQAQRHLQGSERFEDILLGASRPTVIVQRYQEIYSQERIEAYDAIVDIGYVDESELFISAFLLDILKFSYRAASCCLQSLHKGWKRALNIKEGYDADDRTLAAVSQLESAVSIYIRKVSTTFDNQNIISMVIWDLEKCYGSLSYYDLIIQCPEVLLYIESCCSLTWDLVVQNPPMVIKFNEKEFSPEIHTRFHSADKSNDTILCYQWPTLIHESSGLVLIKGIVIT